MKKVVAFLLALIIFVAPVTTLVKADVVIGDNDDIIVNENAKILGRKLAIMESLSDTLLSGATELTISNTEDVDSYLDYLWGEIDTAIEYLDSGEWAGDLSDILASRYFTNLVQYKDYINNRGDYLAETLQNPTTNLLKTYFANNIYGKQVTKHYDLGLDMFRSLSALRHNENIGPANPPIDFSWIQNINYLYQNSYEWLQTDYVVWGGQGCYFPIDRNSVSLVSDDFITTQAHIPNGGNNPSNVYYFYPATSIINISLYTQPDDSVNAVYSAYGIMSNGANYWKVGPNTTTGTTPIMCYWSSHIYFRYVTANEFNLPTRLSFPDMSTAINYIYQHYANINLVVDGVTWAKCPYDSTPSNPTLDIDGLLKIYGNDNPQQYQLQPNTKIDYDQLYQVIYNAIRDNLPISQSDINYYDSHDTIYSPTIINNYGEEDGEESDLIDTILDYAVIPKFDTALAQPMRQALSNGVLIMNNSITNVIPNEILLILGACFFLLLFAVVINRMIK